jgi:hypothetical protein
MPAPAPPTDYSASCPTHTPQGADKCNCGGQVNITCTQPALYKCFGGQCVPEASGVSKQDCDQICDHGVTL